MTAPVIECRDLSVGYDKPVLANLDLTIERGQIVALLGGSGCGKSTLMRTLIGLLPPLGGQVLLFGESLYDLPPDDRNKLLRRTGTAFQQDALFGSMTVAENVALPLRELTRLPQAIVREMVREKLALVGLEDYQQREPANLSGGQRKRVALARAAILDPELALCDEPSAGLDPIVAATIDETLLEFKRSLGITIVIVTHELPSIHKIADRGVMFAKGRGVVADGSIEELARSKDELVHNFFHRVAG